MTRVSEPTAFFDADGDALVPSKWAQGPWGDTISGHILGGLLGWAVEQPGGAADLMPARLTVDLLRPTAMAPVRVQTSVRREGKRIKVVDAEVLQNDTVVCRASSVFLRQGEHPDGEVWASPIVMPPLPDDSMVTANDLPFVLWAFGSDSDSGTLGGTGVEWEQAGLRKFAWVRELRPLIAGDPEVQRFLALQRELARAERLLGVLAGGADGGEQRVGAVGRGDAGVVTGGGPVGKVSFLEVEI